MIKWQKFIAVGLIALLASWAMAQEEVVRYRYGIPFPERTYSGDWQFRVEVSTVEDIEFSVELEGYSSSGELTLKEFHRFASGGVLVWSSPEESRDVPQSLVLVSDHKLHGQLWIWNQKTGQINGVNIGQESAASFLVPHLPKNFFKWKTSFSLIGLNQGSSMGDVLFGYFNDRDSDYQTEVLEEQLWENNYLRRTPYLDALIDGLNAQGKATFGSISTMSEGFHISGFQTFSRVEGTTQTSAVEFTSSGSTSGTVIIGQDPESQFVDSFVLANGHDTAVQLEMTLREWQQSGREGSLNLVTTTELVTLEPSSNRVFVLGGDLFVEASGQAIDLSYRVVAESQEIEPLPIHSLHFRTDTDETIMGGHPFGEVGQALRTWLYVNDDYETALELVNHGESQAFTLNISIGVDSSRLLFVNLNRGEALSITPNWVSEQLDLDLDDLRSTTIALQFQPVETPAAAGVSSLIANQVAFTEFDIALVNPTLQKFAAEETD